MAPSAEAKLPLLQPDELQELLKEAEERKESPGSRPAVHELFPPTAPPQDESNITGVMEETFQTANNDVSLPYSTSTPKSSKKKISYTT